MTSNTLTRYDNLLLPVRCPVCGLSIDTAEFTEHVLDEHPYFFVVWASMNMPWLYSEDILLNNPETDELSYEYLTQLCEIIGDHKEGVNDIELVTTHVVLNEYMTCPICLEDNIVEVRKIKQCSHAFCHNCIERWLSMHKSCPVCKQDVQISSISMVSAEPSSSASPLSSMNTT